MTLPNWLEAFLAFELVRDIPRATMRGLILYTTLTAVFIVLEYVLGKKNARRYRKRSVLNDYVYCIFYNGGYFTLIVYPLLALTENLLAPYRAELLPKMSPWIAVPVFYVVADFAFYWAHRLLHTKYLWPFHAVHHSQQELTVLTTARFHLLDVVVLTIVTTIPAILIGFPAAVAAVTWVLMLQDKVQHADLDWTYGPLYGVVVSPRYHRIHHAADAETYGKNYGLLFTIWDRIFGTAHASREEPVRFGVDGLEMTESIPAQFVTPFRTVWRMIGRPPATRSGAIETAAPTGSVP